MVFFHGQGFQNWLDDCYTSLPEEQGRPQTHTALWGHGTDKTASMCGGAREPEEVDPA